jgi:hypothetical protein
VMSNRTTMTSVMMRGVLMFTSTISLIRSPAGQK